MLLLVAKYLSILHVKSCQESLPVHSTQCLIQRHLEARARIDVNRCLRLNRGLSGVKRRDPFPYLGGSGHLVESPVDVNIVIIILQQINLSPRIRVTVSPLHEY